MAAVELSDDVVDQWADRRWRLSNLYYIQDKHGNTVLFKPKPSQLKLLDDLHYLNLVLKARQMGFSTLIVLMALDAAVFNSNFSAGLVADTIGNATNLLARAKFSYDRLPEEIRQLVRVETDNATTLELSNGSSIEVGVSLRSSTKNFLHISEYGKICAKAPEKAKEIKSGSLNTLAQKQLCFIESTAEGRGGDFYDKVEAAKKIADSGREHGVLDYRLHFFPWFEDDSYELEEPVVLTAEDEKYFSELQEKTGIVLPEPKKWWYAAKKREQGDDMFKEYPSTPEEAFQAAKDGAYFAKQMHALRQRGKIAPLAFDARFPVNTFWDWGINDSAVIWLHQEMAGQHHFVGYYENSGEGPAHYADWLDKWRAKMGARFGVHYAPHDFDTRRPGSNGEITTLKSIFAKLGYAMEVVPRSNDKLTSIQNVRSKLPSCSFDEVECSMGIERLENYAREWDDNYGVWKSQPRHDAASHGSDAFMTFADGYKPAPSNVPKFERRKGIL